MVSQKTIEEFENRFKNSELICVGLIMKNMNVSRVTASNLISSLLNRNAMKGTYRTKIIPYYRPSDARKWYIVSKIKKKKKNPS